jgi:GTP cyclohydrolase III
VADIPEPTGFWAIVGTAVTALVFGAYRTWRTISTDVRNDSVSTIQSTLFTQQQQAIAALNARIDNLVAQSEKYRTERDTALDRIAAQLLEASHLKSELEIVNARVVALQETIETLRKGSKRN